MAARQTATVRKLVLDHFLAHSVPPVAEEIAGQLGIGLPEVRHELEELDAAHHIRLVPGTSRILMAFPFSAVATPYRVIRENGRQYYANCAWDAVAFEPMLGESVRVDSFCAHCNEPLAVDPTKRAGPRSGPGVPLVYLERPAAAWWSDIITTCANTMVFLRSEEHLRRWQAAHGAPSGVALSWEQTVRLSEPLYRRKLDLDYTRPSKAELQSHFDQLGLTGPFWQL